MLTLLALLPFELPSSGEASVECGTMAVVSPVSSCCCHPAVNDDEDCGCAAEPVDAGAGSPAAPAPVPVRTALDHSVGVVVAFLDAEQHLFSTPCASRGTRPHGEVPTRLAYGVFTL